MSQYYRLKLFTGSGGAALGSLECILYVQTEHLHDSDGIVGYANSVRAHDPAEPFYIPRSLSPEQVTLSPDDIAKLAAANCLYPPLAK